MNSSDYCSDQDLEDGGAAISALTFAELAAFRQALRRFIRLSELSAREAGITPQQHQLLLALRSDPQRKWASISELADTLQLSHHSTVGLVNRCQSSGLVLRSSDPDDRRVVRVTLTPEGEGRLAEISLRNLPRHKELRDVTDRLRMLADWVP